MFDNTTTHLDGPEFLDAVADAEEALGNHINAAEYRRRARQWSNERAQHEREAAAVDHHAPMKRRSSLPPHHITPTDHR